jgi:hypothetical protein
MAVVSKLRTSEGERRLGRSENNVGAGLRPAMRSLSRAGGAHASARAVIRACPQARPRCPEDGPHCWRERRAREEDWKSPSSFRRGSPMTMTTARSVSRVSSCQTRRCLMLRYIRIPRNSPRSIVCSIRYPIRYFDRVTWHSCHAHHPSPDHSPPLTRLPQDMACVARHETCASARSERI